MHTGGRLELAHVICVQTAVFVGCCEVEGLHGIPSDAVGFGLHDELADGGGGSQVIQGNASV